MKIDTLYYNADVVTMDDSLPTATAVAVTDGKIAAVGSSEDLLLMAGPDTKKVDVGGSTILPGFIDAHGHFGWAAMVGSWANLKHDSYYDRSRVPMSVILDKLVQHGKDYKLAPDEWLLGFGYHEALLNENRKIKKADLDKISTEQPIFVAHKSGHSCTFNSKALELMGITADTPDPAGSTICRITGTSEPDGEVLGPLGQKIIFGEIPVEKPTHNAAKVKNAQDEYFRWGITTAQEGKTSRLFFDLIDEANEAGRLKLDIGSYLEPHVIDGVLEDGRYKVGQYRKHLKVCGIKLMMDGTLSGTALLTRPYDNNPNNYGLAYLTEDEYVEKARRALENGWQFAVHAIGDAAIDRLLDGYERLVKEMNLDITKQRNIGIHYSVAREDQIERSRQLGIFVSFFPSIIGTLGEFFAGNIGADRSYAICPVRYATDRHMMFSLHNDYPINGPDPLILVWNCAVRGSLTSDKILRPDLRIPVKEAFKGITTYAAYQYFEEDRKGSLTPGKVADMVIMDRNLMKIDPTEIPDLNVLTTIKDGEVVYEK